MHDDLVNAGIVSNALVVLPVSGIDNTILAPAATGILISTIGNDFCQRIRVLAIIGGERNVAERNQTMQSALGDHLAACLFLIARTIGHGRPSHRIPGTIHERRAINSSGLSCNELHLEFLAGLNRAQVAGTIQALGDLNAATHRDALAIGEGIAVELLFDGDLVGNDLAIDVLFCNNLGMRRKDDGTRHTIHIESPMVKTVWRRGVDEVQDDITLCPFANLVRGLLVTNPSKALKAVRTIARKVEVNHQDMFLRRTSIVLDLNGFLNLTRGKVHGADRRPLLFDQLIVAHHRGIQSHVGIRELGVLCRVFYGALFPGSKVNVARTIGVFLLQALLERRIDVLDLNGLSAKLNESRVGIQAGYLPWGHILSQDDLRSTRGEIPRQVLLITAKRRLDVADLCRRIVSTCTNAGIAIDDNLISRQV